MSLYSYSSSSLKSSESNNSYRLLSTSSLTTVSSQIGNNGTRRNLTTDDEQWPTPPEEENQSWQIEKNISLKNEQLNRNGCVIKAIMTNERIVLYDSSSTQSTIIPGKHISIKVVFNV
ncbi:unnamed protein product [Adineta steineri]|uniref:Uncharacterized protein n=1 Tax=Adineta steineri TaxID=433720 RepID=A0A819LN03_9BILA|nr:unnamed protein product [Adineta steineri]CAF3964193.1 unnamed protein product [Adineta steineri]